MSMFLSCDPRDELADQNETQQHLDAVINEAITNNELESALEAIQEVSPPSVTLLEEVVDDDDFQQPPPPQFRYGKNLTILGSKRRRSSPSCSGVRSPSPTPSTASSPHTSASAMDEWSTLITEEVQRREEEVQRRAEFRQRINGGEERIRNTMKKKLDLMSQIKGEKRALRNQREIFRENIRALDAKELSLDKRERSTHHDILRCEAMLEKFKIIKD